jgi:hypothetical protein
LERGAGRRRRRRTSCQSPRRPSVSFLKFKFWKLKFSKIKKIKIFSF